MADKQDPLSREPELRSRTRREQDLEEVLAQFLLEQEEGQKPAIDDYLARYPRFAADLAVLLEDPLGHSAGATLAEDATEMLGPARHRRPLVRVGPYEVIEKIAEGGGGTVYRARHVEGRHVVALKVLDRFGVGDDRELERFRREARVLRALDLVGVVPAYEVGEEDGRLWMAMKWIEGQTLAGLREAVKTPAHPLHPLRERARMVARLARTFGAVHGHGIVHRDVKPSNILIDRLGEPVVIDFGIARTGAKSDLTQTLDGVLGTPRYLAPELLRHGNAGISPQSDLYGLGLCLYEFMTGAQAFVQTQRDTLFEQIQTQGPPRPSVVAPRIPFELEAIILRATEIDPARRYPSMVEFAADLEAYSRGEVPAKATLRRARPWRRGLLKHRKKLPYVAAGLIVGVVLAVLMGKSLLSKRRIAAHLEALSPWHGAPFEALLSAPGSLREEARRLAESSDDPEHDFQAAWILDTMGASEDAAAVLGPAREGESGTLRLFRGWLELVMQNEDSRPTTVVGPGLTGHSLQSYPATAGGWREMDESDQVRVRRLAPPLLDRVADLLTARETRATDAGGRLLSAHLRWRILTGLEEPEEAGLQWKDLAEAAMQARDRSPNEDWPLWYVAMASLSRGDYASARRDLDQFLAKRPEIGAAWHLRAVVDSSWLAADGDPLVASRAYSEAAKSYGRTPPRSGILHTEPRRHLCAAWAWHAASTSDLALVDHVVMQWKDLIPEWVWQDEVFSRLARARALERAGQIELATRELLAAADQYSDFALPLLELARLMEAQSREDSAERIREEAGSRRQKVPGDMATYLRSMVFGLHPYGVFGRLGTGWQWVRDGQAIENR